jgi:predicted acyltransferase
MTPAPTQRLLSLDAFRGATMLFMASEIWRLPKLAEAFPDSAFWQALRFHTSHAEWTGGSLWDLIQPSFMFMVGVALPWSVANRRAKGQGLRDLWAHALWRSLLLVALGIFLRSVGRKITYFSFEDVLSQIGLGYPILFALAWTRMRTQIAAAAAVLAGYWAAFALYPAAGADFASHWAKHANLAGAFDVWFLNLFPREQVFEMNRGGYQTLSFIPSLGTMLFGLIAGGVLRSGKPAREIVRVLLVWAAASFALGWLLGATGACPVVKRIWTPSWALASGGCVLGLLTLFYWLVDLRDGAKWSYWLRVVGLNSIAMYTIVHLWDRFLVSSAEINLGWNVLSLIGEPWRAHAPWVLAWAFLWWCCVWLDRNKVYLRL